MKSWLLLLQALQKGSILTDPTKWKTQQVVINAVVGLAVALYQLAVAKGWLPDGFNEDLLTQIVTAVGALIWAIYNAVVTTATTTKIGLGIGDGGSSDGMHSSNQVSPKGSVGGGDSEPSNYDKFVGNR